MHTGSKTFKQRIPWLMAAVRAGLGPAIVIGERAGWSVLTLAMLVVTGFFSDIFDGVLARRWKCDTAAVRVFDSIADIVFYIGCGAALWIRSPQLVRSFSVPIAAIVSLEALCIGVAVVKFGKPPSYHSYMAKVWGLILAPTIVLSFAAPDTAAVQIAWWVSLAVGALACLEGLAISVIMPEWRHDLKSLPRALGVRRRILLEQKRLANRNLRRAAAAAAIVLVALVTMPSHAAEISSVRYVGGSAPGIATGVDGALETDSDQLTFQWSGGSLHVPYSQIQNLSYRDRKVLDLGALPTAAFLLIFPQIHDHLVTITYLDGSGQKQVAIFQILRDAKDTLPVVLQERTGLCIDQYQLPCRPVPVRTLQRPLAATEIVQIPRR